MTNLVRLIYLIQRMMVCNSVEEMERKIAELKDELIAVRDLLCRFLIRKDSRVYLKHYSYAPCNVTMFVTGILNFKRNEELYRD